MARSRVKNKKRGAGSPIAPTKDSQRGIDTPYFHGVVHTLIVATCGKEWQQFVSELMVQRATSSFTLFMRALPAKLSDSCRYQSSPCTSAGRSSTWGLRQTQKTLMHNEEGWNL